MSLTVLIDSLGSKIRLTAEHRQHILQLLLGLYVPIITTPVELLNWEGASDEA
jgi:hypothetical protein